jgi:hypothetical protein
MSVIQVGQSRAAGSDGNLSELSRRESLKKGWRDDHIGSNRPLAKDAIRNPVLGVAYSAQSERRFHAIVNAR